MSDGINNGTPRIKPGDAGARGAACALGASMIPADVSAPDVKAEQKRNVEAVVTALRTLGVPNVVLLSSWVAELSEPVGGIVGCHHFEQLLNQIPALNVVCQRPVWFMENFLWNIGFTGQTIQYLNGPRDYTMQRGDADPG